MIGNYHIPFELIEMIKTGRVIPFIGAGFSAGLELPGWDQMLSEIASEIGRGVDHQKVKELCNGDLLQVAEYYYLMNDKNIGPLRHVITTSLKPKKNYIQSGAHIELANLGARQIYTTNYDDLVEKVYKILGIDIEVIALPKNVATSDGKKHQLVKFHGDLRYDDTLVLTESSYFSRLDLESPMDIKFRSDILGKSVLFMGYSFRDINIRIIWFKLMQMMKGIPDDNRPKSYMVTFSPNPVLEKLYDSVGIKTIVLDPTGKELSKEERNDLFADFMLELTIKSSEDGFIPGSENQAMYCSYALLDRLNRGVKESKEHSGKFPSVYFDLLKTISVFEKREIHKKLKQEVLNLLQELSIINDKSLILEISKFAIKVLQQIGLSEPVATIIIRGLCYSSSRSYLLTAHVPWKKIWEQKITKEFANEILSKLDSELQFHGMGGFDDDIAYIVDLAFRIKEAQIIEPNEEIQNYAHFLISGVNSFYNGVEKYESNVDGMPNISFILEMMTAKRDKDQEIAETSLFNEKVVDNDIDEEAGNDDVA